MTKQNENLDVEKALEVSACIELDQIRIVACSAELYSIPQGEKTCCQRYASTEVSLAADRKLLLSFINFRLQASCGNEMKVAQVTAKYLADYRLNEHKGLEFTEKQFAAFAKYNGVFNAWPYWREFVQSMTARLNLPPLTLPVFRFGNTLPEYSNT